MGKVTLSPDERRARLEAAGAELATAVESIVTGDDWRRALAFAAKLHHYSANNCLLVMVQAAERGIELSHVAGYRTWQSLGRQVRKGEKGLAVLAPVRYMVDDEKSGDKVPVVRGFKVEHVFADSQTEGETDIPTRPMPTLLTGEGPEGLYGALAKLVDERGYSLTVTALDGPNGETEYGTRSVRLGSHLEPAAATKTLAHELGHVLLHEGTKLARDQVECEAESVAYLVLDAFGMVSGDYSFPYVAGWSQGKTATITAALDTAKRCAGEIIAAISETESGEVAA